MIEHIEVIRKKRATLLEQLNGLTNGQLNQIPEGFNNSIVWNLGHMIAVQQGICYKKAALPVMISDQFWDMFRPGSRPQELISDEETAHIRHLLLSTLDKLKTDYRTQIFGNYSPWTARNGIELESIDDAVKFLSFHEELHSGAIMAIKQALETLDKGFMI